MEITKSISYRLQFIESVRFIAHYQILLITFLKKSIKLNVNTDMMIKKCETCEIKYKDCGWCLESTTVKD